MSFTINKSDYNIITKLNKPMLDLSFSNGLLYGEGLLGFKKVECNFNQHYFFKDNGADILAVAHLDTVQSGYWYYVKNNVLYSPVTDDRMGVYTLLHLLPSLGINFDVLLTIDEEHLNSSAQFFHTEKQYNWMFAFDRRGDDAVLYSYHNDKLENELRQNGFHIGFGSYSDIVELDDLDCCGINFGTAYFNYHFINGYVDLRMLMKQALKFRNFYNANHNTYFKSTPQRFNVDMYYHPMYEQKRF